LKIAVTLAWSVREIIKGLSPLSGGVGGSLLFKPSQYLFNFLLVLLVLLRHNPSGL
jgi:hypothetical protein